MASSTLRWLSAPALLAAWLAACLPASRAIAAISVQDDAQRSVSLDKPAQRIISLAPHTTEILFAAGAGAQLVGVSEYSDFPEQAKKIASVGNVFALDIERVLALKPDLVVVWGTGNGAALADKLRGLHLNVYQSDPHDYEGIASSIERMAALAGTSATGNKAAGAFRHRLEALRNTYRQPAGVKPVTVFYQIWRSPLMTLNDTHMVSSAIRLCGGENIFGKLREVSPTVNVEAVLKANPEAIMTTDGEKQESLADWLRFDKLAAVEHSNLYVVKGDWINRSGPRILDGTEAVCKFLDTARKRRR
ncbi:cobalamin-binding protein [Undibacterium sp. TJN25]|uniref:cobalamin-binding protein n=1 Tax=Undibacterium sp. TJN25 TaxID=3413056 RepID=UPI003BEFA73A